VARLGGDEFVILLEDNVRSDTLPHIAQKIQRTLEPPHQLGPHWVQATASIGVSSYPRDGTEINTLLGHADHAMYSVKTQGGNKVSQFSETL